MLLFNIINNRQNKLVNNSNKENIIYCRQTKNATSFQLPNTKEKKVTSNCKIEKKIESANWYIFKTSFFY